MVITLKAPLSGWLVSYIYPYMWLLYMFSARLYMTFASYEKPACIRQVIWVCVVS